MPKYKRLIEMMDAEQDGDQPPRTESRSSQLSRRSSKTECHSQFSEESFQRDLHKRPNVVGPGGVLLPQKRELDEMLEDDRATVMCFTWNIASKSVRSLQMLSDLFQKIEPNDRPDVIAIALQELPASTVYFHSDMVAVVEKALKDTHRVYCWVRKWSQMVMIFIRKKLSLYASYPEYQFVATKRLASPFRTKGAIGICFRLLQTTCVFIACHLTHGKLRKRISDYHKLSRNFDFEMLKRVRSADPNNVPIKRASNVFWFGDLNFRICHLDAAQILNKQLESRLFKNNLDFESLIRHDELTNEKNKGFIFENFKEGSIHFPPTHKFFMNTNQYVANRIPSYTDRVLYWSRNEKDLYPVRYDCVWDLTVSDHKPVYCTFKMRVIDSDADRRNTDSVNSSNVFDSSTSRTTSAS